MNKVIKFKRPDQVCRSCLVRFRSTARYPGLLCPQCHGGAQLAQAIEFYRLAARDGQ